MTERRETYEAVCHEIEKERLLEVLSKKLGCPSQQVRFLFQSKNALSSQQDLSIPEERHQT